MNVMRAKVKVKVKVKAKPQVKVKTKFNVKMKFIVIHVFIVMMGLVSSSVSLSKEMVQRLGVGIKNNTSQSLPSLAAVYHLSGNLAMTGGFGIDTQKDYSALQMQVGIRHVVFHENNLHFYVGGQMGLVSFENPVDGKNSGFEANLIAGTEFFFAGLENVAFTFEGGLGLSSIKNTRVRTIADDPVRAGIIFYF